MARVADRCLKFEEEDGYAGFQVNIAVYMTIVVNVVILAIVTQAIHILLMLFTLRKKKERPTPQNTTMFSVILIN